MKKLLIISTTSIILVLVACCIIVSLFGVIRLQAIPSVLFNEEDDNTSSEIVDILVQVNDDYPISGSQLVEYKDDVKLYLAIKKDRILYCDNQLLIELGEAKPLKQLVGFDKSTIQWKKLETELILYSTRESFESLSEDLGPRMTKIAWKIFDKLEGDKLRYVSYDYKKKRTSVSLNQKSLTNKSIKLDGKYVGTMRYSVSLKLDGEMISTPGEWHLNHRKFEINDEVLRVSVKGNIGNEVLDYAFAYGNLPYYFGSFSFKFGWYGSDCAKYVSVVYDQLGYNPGYLSSINLRDNHKIVHIINGLSEDGYYLSYGEKLKYGEDIFLGDPMVISPTPKAHAGFLGEDKNSNGYLDVDDYVLHTSRMAPQYQKISETSIGIASNNLVIIKF